MSTPCLRRLSTTSVTNVEYACLRYYVYERPFVDTRLLYTVARAITGENLTERGTLVLRQHQNPKVYAMSTSTPSFSDNRPVSGCPRTRNGVRSINNRIAGQILHQPTKTSGRGVCAQKNRVLERVWMCGMSLSYNYPKIPEGSPQSRVVPLQPLQLRHLRLNLPSAISLVLRSIHHPSTRILEDHSTSSHNRNISSPTHPIVQLHLCTL